MGAEKPEGIVGHLVESERGFNSRMGGEILSLFFQVSIGGRPNEDSPSHFRVLRRRDFRAERFLSQKVWLTSIGSPEASPSSKSASILPTALRF